LLAITAREYRRIKWLTIKGVGHSVVIVVLIETISESCAVGIGESLVNLAVTIVILTITDFIVVIDELVAHELASAAYNGALDANVSIFAVAIIIECRLTQAIRRDGVAVIILAVTQFGVLRVWIITD